MTQGSTVRVRPEDLATLADRCIDLAIGLTSAISDSASGLTVAPRDAGDTDGGYKTTAAHGPCAEAAHDAIESLAAVLEADAEGLMLFAFAISDADETSAKAMLASSSAPTGPRPTPPSPPPAPR
ncbi:hypothetical protein ACWIGW_30590 [Nocardia brasiliensis]